VTPNDLKVRGSRSLVQPSPTAARALPRVYASTALSMASYAIVSVALPFRFQHLGLSVLQYGTVLAVYAFGMLATESLWGAVAFRVGRPRIIVALGIVVALVTLSIGLVQSFLGFAVTLGLLGMLVISTVPLTRWLAVTARGPGTEGRGTGRYGLFFGLGLVGGTSTGPLLFVEYGFFFVALVGVALSVVATVLLALVPWDQVALPPRTTPIAREVQEMFTRNFVLCSSLVVVYLLAYSLTTGFLQYYSVSVFGGTPSEAGYVIGAARGVTIVTGVVLGSVVDRWGPGRSAPGGFLLLAAGALGTFFSVAYGEMVVATLAFSVGAGWLSACLLPLALGPVPRRAQGTAIGVFGSFEDLGLLVGPLLIGSVYSTYGAVSTFPVVAAVALIGSALAALLPGWTRAPTESRPPTLPRHA
jgi:MFS family permease